MKKTTSIFIFSLGCIVLSGKTFSEDNPKRFFEINGRSKDFQGYPNTLIKSAMTALNTSVIPDVNEAACDSAMGKLVMMNTLSRRDVITQCMTGDKLSLDKKYLNLLVILVYLYDRRTGDYCAGTLVSHNKVLTAKHCKPSDIFFSNGEHQSLTGDANIYCNVLSYPHCDWKFIAIKYVNITIPVIKWENSNLNDALWIPGFAAEDLSIHGSAKSYVGTNIKWPKIKKNNCKTFFSSNDCLVYFCPLLSGYSGAPIIDFTQSEKQDAIIVSGIHSAGGLDSSACPFKRNIGAAGNSGSPSSIIHD